MKLPRDMGGGELAVLLGKYDYQITRQTGSHMRLTSNSRGSEHHVTIPERKPLRVGTLHSIVSDVAAHLEIERQTLSEELFA